MAIALGLVIGKQLGVFGATFALVKLGFARLPEGASWLQLYGIAALAGIGFTMSLFIGSLNFETDAQMNAVRLGVLAGSLVSALGFSHGGVFSAGRVTPFASGGVVSVGPEEAYASMQETLYLLSSPANARALMRSVAQLKAGKAKKRKLLDA